MTIRRKLRKRARVLASPCSHRNQSGFLRTRVGAGSSLSLQPSETSEAIKAIMHTKDVIFDETAVISGLNFLEGGGDFADAMLAVDVTGFSRDSRDV